MIKRLRDADEEVKRLRAPRDDIEYFGCWTLAHDIKPNEAKANFRNGLLTITVPLAKPMKGRKIPVE